MRYSFLTIFLIAGLFSSSSQATEIRDAAKAAGLVPHKALYDIRLSNTKSGSQIVNIRGQMLYEWESSCDAWTTDQRFNLSYEYADSPPLNITSDFSTYETFDGKSMNFTSQKKQDGQIFEEIRGQATQKDDGTGEAIFTMPKDLEFDLKSGTLLPMQHTLKTLEAIRGGKKFYTATVFDGGDKDGPVEVNAVVGKSVTVITDPKASPDVDPTLTASPAHKVRLAFFPLKDSSEAAADYEMSAVFHDNGVISDMLVDYKDFSVHQKLIALESLKAGDSACNGQNKKGGIESPKQ